MNALDIGFTAVLETMPNCDDLLLKIPDVFTRDQGWLVGDVLVFDVQKNLTILVTNKTKLQRAAASHKRQK